jgi:hypothetical protein
MHSIQKFWLLSGFLVLAGCGGGDNNDGPILVVPPPPVRGTLTTNPPNRMASLSAPQLLTAIGVNAQLAQVVSAPTCGVDVYSIQYNTVGGSNEATTASGAMMVPTGSAATCQGNKPIVLYAHGTTTDKAYNIAAFSTTGDTEGLLIAAVFAAQGYIVIAPNYAGYDSSTLAYTPYLNADQESKDMIDALAAARSALPAAGAPTVRDSGKLFITGYSQGGHVAMATHRAMQAAGSTVTASAPMSGPYALAAFGDAVFYGDVDLGAPVFSTLLVSSYQHAYGNIYTNTSDIFEPKYATGIDTLLPSTTSIGNLVTQGKLPQTAMFSTVPPSSDFIANTPPTAPAALASLFALGFAADHLVTNAYRLAYLTDEVANPDGAFPTTTTALPPANPGNALRKAFKTNDLRTWTPTAPMLLCGGDNDPTVFFFNTQFMQSYWAAIGANPPVTVLDVDASVTAGDPYAALKTGFSIAKTALAVAAVAQGATDGGASAVTQNYHAALVPPFCLTAVRSFFDGK